MSIYKILLPGEWAQFDERRCFEGSPFDLDSGFVHCSSRAQVGATALRVFRGEPALVVVALDERKLGDVRWEPASDGDAFPHVYGVLPYAAITAVHHVAGAALVEGTLLAEEQVRGGEPRDSP